METEENKRAVIVGIFIALGLVIFVVGIFTLGGQQNIFAKNFKIKAVFSDISGLKKGNNIWFSGVKVGTVNDVKFIGLSRVEVDMVIQHDVQNYIHKDAGVHIGSDGLIGNRIVVINGGSAQAPVIDDGDEVQVEQQVSTEEMMKTLQKNNENLVVITNDFKKISSNIAQGKGLVGALMTDSVMALKFKAMVNNLNATAANTQKVALGLNRFSDKLNSKGGLVDEMLTDTAVFNHLKASVTQLNKSTAEAGKMIQSLSNAGANLNKATDKLNSTDNIIGVLLNDPKGAAKLQNTLYYLNESSIKLNDDLEAVQHNFLLRGFFKKKARAAQADQ